MEIDESTEFPISGAFRKQVTELGELYSIMRATEHLETAFVKDLISVKAYTDTCNKLLGQFRMQQQSLVESGALTDVGTFMKEYAISLPKAYKRLVVEGVPCKEAKEGEGDMLLLVHDATSTLITAMDTVRVAASSEDGGAADELAGCVTAVCEALNRIDSRGFLPPGFAIKGTIDTWLHTLRGLRAADKLSADQLRQLGFDLENLYNAFDALLRAKKANK